MRVAIKANKILTWKLRGPVIGGQTLLVVFFRDYEILRL
jgi:hypothetical protein